MAPVYRYPSYVTNVETIDYQGTVARRSKLTIKLAREGVRQALFVMMNPSRATSEISDKTVNGVIKYTFEHSDVLSSISRIVVLNLYTVYETASGQLGSLVAQHGFEFAAGNDRQSFPKNDELLSQEVNNSKFVIAAWGKPTATIQVLRECGYFRRILDVLPILESQKTFHLDTSLRENLYPKHPVLINYSWALNRLNISELHEKIQKRYGQPGA